CAILSAVILMLAFAACGGDPEVGGASSASPDGAASDQSVVSGGSSSANSSGGAASSETAISVPAAGVTQMTVGVWTDGNLAANGTEWFRFTAAAAEQYIHFKPGALSSVFVQVLADDGSAVGGAIDLFTGNASISRTLIAGRNYYIRSWPWAFVPAGSDYQIALNTSAAPPP
ncbi:MAG: hypothetical protein LBC99_03990, partial [Spirochaetota bacterium]|nr:hypothetical protein [Spirochaetota bacterium]